MRIAVIKAGGKSRISMRNYTVALLDEIETSRLILKQFILAY